MIFLGAECSVILFQGTLFSMSLWLDIYTKMKTTHFPLNFLLFRTVFITVRNSTCGKVMFLHLSVILFTGGCLPLGRGM